MKRKFLLICTGVMIASSLSGCANNEIAQLNSMPSLNSEANTDEGYSMSLGEKQSAIYAQVSERQLLDLSLLSDCSDEEVQAVKTYMNNVDSQLTGQTAAKDGVIDECFTDYLLSEFEKTPYYWQRTKTVIRGVDSASGNIVVDVTYNTIETQKEVMKDSFIVMGEPDYDTKASIRQEKWNNILVAKYNSSMDWQAMWDEFVKIYGEPQEIFESQRNLGLTEQVFETGNQRTYSGMVDNEMDKDGAQMTVRFILVPNYVLGINLGLNCEHMYVTEYQINNDKTTDMSLFKEDGYATITDNVTKLMNSYFKCIDENDMSGMYKLTKDFKKLDKYYQDMFDTTYTKHSSFSISLFDIEGTHINAGIEVSSKVRAKGSNMTMPIYTDRYYVEFELVDDQLQVSNMTLLSRVLEGEPTIDTEEIESDGFTAAIDLSNQDKKDIEELICNFSALQLQEDTTSDKFSDLVDLSMSDEKLASTRENMLSLGGTKKVVWLQTYQQGTSNYASVKCRELYQQDDNSIIEATVSYEFISKGDRWYVYDYNVLSTVKLDTTNLSTSNSLCYVTPGKVEQYTSQIVSVKSDEDTGDGEDSNTEANGVVIEHDVSAPVLKSGSEEEGLVKMTAEEVTDDDLKQFIIDNTGEDEEPLTLTEIRSLDNSLGLEGENTTEYTIRSLYAIRYNKNNNRYTEKELEDIDIQKRDMVKAAKEAWDEANKDSENVRENRNMLKRIETVVDNAGR